MSTSHCEFRPGGKKEEAQASIEALALGIELYDGQKWGPCLDLAPYLHEVLRAHFAQFPTFRLVVYGQFAAPRTVPQSGEPVQENLAGAGVSGTPPAPPRSGTSIQEI